MGEPEPVLTEADVARILSNAAWCAHRLPGRPGPRYANVWLALMDMAPVDDSYPEDKRIFVHPSPELIADLERATEWMIPLPVRGRRILWLRAEGNHWRYIGRQVGITHVWAQKLWRKYAQEIIERDQIVTYGQLRAPTGS